MKDADNPFETERAEHRAGLHKRPRLLCPLCAKEAHQPPIQKKHNDDYAQVYREDLEEARKMVERIVKNDKFEEVYEEIFDLCNLVEEMAREAKEREDNE